MKSDWSLSEPNMGSAIRKNKDGICAMHECKNKLSSPPDYGFLGVKICDECRKPMDELRKQMLKEVHEETNKWIFDVIRKKLDDEKKKN